MFTSEHHISASEGLDLAVIIKELENRQPKPVYNSFFDTNESSDMERRIYEAERFKRFDVV